MSSDVEMKEDKRNIDPTTTDGEQGQSPTLTSASPGAGTGASAAAVTQSESNPGWEDLINNLQPDHTSFYINMGEPYKGIFFTLDPEIVEFTESDCLNALVLEPSNNRHRRVDILKLDEVFRKCPNVENLKFFGVKITSSLLKLITKRCPRLENLELNPHELKSYGSKLSFYPEIHRLVKKCKNLCNLIIRNPGSELQKFLSGHNDFCFDCIDANWIFVHRRSDYDTMSHACHNVNFGNTEDGPGGCVQV